MRPFFLLLLTCTVALARGPRAHEPLPIKPLPTVTQEATAQAEALLRELPTLASADAAERLAALLKNHDIPRDAAGPWFELIARVGGPQELQQIYVGVLTSLADDCCEGAPGADFDDKLAFVSEDDLIRAATKALIDAAEKRGARPASPYVDARLHLGRHIYWQCPEGMAGDLARLAALYRVTEDYESVVDLLAHAKFHRAAFNALLLLDPKEAADAVESTCLDLGDTLSARAALLLLARTVPERALRNTGLILSAPMDAEALADLWQQLLAATPFAELLAETLPAYLPEHVLAAGENAARAAGLAELADKLRPSATRAPSDFAGLAEDARLHGSAARGELLFRDSSALCAECHALGEVGSKRGPDLAKLAAMRKPWEIVSAVLQPCAHTTPDYEVALSAEKEATVLPGSGDPVALRKIITRPRASRGQDLWRPPGAIPWSGSAMPTGLTDGLTLQEIRDLMAFLLQLGAPGGLDAADHHVARQWRIEAQDPEHPAHFLQRDGPTGGTGEVTSLANGSLRRTDCLDALHKTERAHPFYLQTYFDVPADGQVRFTFGGLSKVWLNKRPVDNVGAAEFSCELAAGRHRFDALLIPQEMPKEIRVASPDAIFSTRPLYPADD